MRGSGLLHLLVGAAVVEQPHRQLVGRVVHADRRGERGGEQALVLVVGRHEDVDGRKPYRPAVARARGRCSGSTMMNRLMNSIRTENISIA